MDRDAYLKAVMAASGIPKYALAHTLQRVYPLLRQHLESKAFMRDGYTKSILIYPQNFNLCNEARLIFYLVCKELILIGQPVSVHHLSFVLNAYQDSLFVTDGGYKGIKSFHEYGVGSPMEGIIGLNFRTMVEDRIESRKGLVLLASNLKWDDWYPKHFSAFICKNSDIFEIKPT